MGDELRFRDVGIRFGAGGTLADEIFPTWARLATESAQTREECAVAEWLRSCAGVLPRGALLCLEEVPALSRPDALAFFARVLAAHHRSVAVDHFPFWQLAELHAQLRDALGDAACPSLSLPLHGEAYLETRALRRRLYHLSGQAEAHPDEVAAAFEALFQAEERSGNAADAFRVLFDFAAWAENKARHRLHELYTRLAQLEVRPEDRALWLELAAQEPKP